MSHYQLLVMVEAIRPLSFLRAGNGHNLLCTMNDEMNPIEGASQPEMTEEERLAKEAAAAEGAAPEVSEETTDEASA